MLLKINLLLLIMMIALANSMQAHEPLYGFVLHFLL